MLKKPKTLGSVLASLSAIVNDLHEVRANNELEASVLKNDAADLLARAEAHDKDAAQAALVAGNMEKLLGIGE